MGDSRSTIAKPATFERDGFRYVDAASFLEWLSQYICQKQAKIEFPSELIDTVRIAIAKAAAERPPCAPEEFRSLTLALDGEFNKALDALPDTLRKLVEEEFFPMPWDSLNDAGRRSVALQLDYQRDPATEPDRQFWWDFYERMHEVQAQIKEWEGTETPTATDKSLKEARLKELRQEHERMKLQQRQARGDYFPGQKCSAKPDTSLPTDADFIAYPKAMKMLTDKLNATPEELATWIFLGPDTGGIAAYLSANELNPRPRFHFDVFMGEDYLSPLMACWFRRSDIESFAPASQAAIPSSSNNDPCKIFREMIDLQPSEIAITIVGDNYESGLAGNSMLEISARNVKKRVSVAQFGLVDKRGGVLDGQAAVLVGLAHGKKIIRRDTGEKSKEAISATMKRLRAQFRGRLGVKANPFSQHSQESGWQPLFTIADLRGRADNRAKEKAERRTVSFDQMQEQGHQFAADGDDVVSEDVTAEEWIKENGHSWKS